MFKCTHIIFSCTSRYFTSIQRYQIILHIDPNVSNHHKGIHIYPIASKHRIYIQTYRNTSNYTETHPATGPTQILPNMYLNTPRRQTKRLGGTEISRNLNKSVYIKVYYENTGIIFQNAKCPVCFITSRLMSALTRGGQAGKQFPLGPAPPPIGPRMAGPGWPRLAHK